MLPDRAIMYVAAIEDGQFKNEKKQFWEDVYGVNMNCLTPTVMREPLIDIVPESMIMTTPCKILELNLCTMKGSDVEFSSKYKIESLHDDKVHAMISWWDCIFSELKNPVTLSTSPFERSTHWKQTVFYTEFDLQVKKGDLITGSIANRKSHKNYRELDIKISYHLATD